MWSLCEGKGYVILHDAQLRLSPRRDNFSVHLPHRVELTRPVHSRVVACPAAWLPVSLLGSSGDCTWAGCSRTMYRLCRSKRKVSLLRVSNAPCLGQAPGEEAPHGTKALGPGRDDPHDLDNSRFEGKRGLWTHHPMVESPFSLEKGSLETFSTPVGRVSPMTDALQCGTEPSRCLSTVCTPFQLLAKQMKDEFAGTQNKKKMGEPRVLIPLGWRGPHCWTYAACIRHVPPSCQWGTTHPCRSSPAGCYQPSTTLSLRWMYEQQRLHFAAAAY